MAKLFHLISGQEMLGLINAVLFFRWIVEVLTLFVVFTSEKVLMPAFPRPGLFNSLYLLLSITCRSISKKSTFIFNFGGVKEVSMVRITTLCCWFGQ